MHARITEGVLFRSEALGSADFAVRSLEGEDSLNGDYRFRIHVELPEASIPQSELEHILEAPAAIQFIEGERELNHYSGVVAELSVLPDVEHRRTDLYIELVPRLALAAHQRGSELFVGKTVPQVIVEKLEAMGLQPKRDFRSILQAVYARREFVAQYEESDLAFVRRLCEAVGVTTYYEEVDGREVLVLSDGTAPFEEAARPRLLARQRSDHPAAYQVHTTLRRVPRDIQVHDYNYRTPRLALVERAPTKRAASFGEWSEYGAHARSTDEARRLTATRTEEHGARHHVVEGLATEASLRPGRLIHLVDALASEQSLLLTRVVFRFRRAEGEAPSGAELPGWENRFFGIPRGTPFRPPRVTPTPKISGLLSATVDGAIQGDYAELDELGRYHLRFAHDRSGRAGMGATHPVRMIQPHAGANYGMHFPLRPGAEVLVGFVNGDPDRPVIVGTAPSPVTVSPVTLRNQTQNVLRTGANNELVLEDLKDNERIRIHTPHAATTVQLGSVEEAEEGILMTTQAHLTAASRRSHNTITDRQTTIARSTTSMLGERMVMVAGLRGVTAAAESAIERPGAVSDAALASDLRRVARPPVLPMSLDQGGAATSAGPEENANGALLVPTSARLQSDASARAAERTDDAAMELVRALSLATDLGLDAAQGRVQGEPLGVPADPAAIVASERTAALVGREVAMVSGDRVAALSSPKAAAVLGQETAVLKSAGDVEVAGARSVALTTSGELDVAARTARLVAGYYPEAEAPKLDEGTSLGIMSKRDLRVTSVEDCILLCAHKNFIGSAHQGDVRMHAQQTVLLRGGAIHGSAGSISLESSADTKLEVGGDLTARAGGEVTIEGSTITLRAGTIRIVGNVLVEGDMLVSGKTNL